MRTHWNHQVQNTIPTGAVASQVSSKPQGECPHSPRGSGATVGYHKKGYPKQEPKMLLKPCKNQSQKTIATSLQNSPIRSRPCAEASYERPKAPRRCPLAETLSPRPRPKRSRMGCQFSDSFEVGLGKHTRNLRARSNLLFYHSPLTVQGLLCFADTCPAFFHLSWVRR